MAEEDELSDTMSTTSEQSEFEMDFDAPSQYDFTDYVVGDRERLVDSATYEAKFVIWLLNFRLRNEYIDPDISYDEFCTRFGDRFPADMDDGEKWCYWVFREWDCHAAKFTPHGSAYLHPEKWTSVGLGVKGLYDFRTPAELKQFVVQRGLRDPYPAGVTLKTEYIRLLDKADRAYSFRLLDLPSEMRLNIYQKLLLFEKSGGQKYCYPAILCASREIYEEAYPVLYGENVIKCSFKVSADGDLDSIRWTSKVHNEMVHSGCSHAPYVRIPDGIDDYPEFLRHISRLRIKIVYTPKGIDGMSVESSYYPLSHYLCTLASFLMDGHRLKNIQIDVNMEDVEIYAYGQVLFPLRRLRNVKKVRVTGLPAESTVYKQRLIKDMTSVEPVFNTMKHWKLLQDDAAAQLDLLHTLLPDEGCECGECSTSTRIEEILLQLQCLEREKTECCLSSVLEEHVMARLSVLRHVLTRIETSNVEAMVKAFAAKRKALKQYEAVTDDGRLDEAAKIWRGKFGDYTTKHAPDHDWSDDEHDYKEGTSKANMPGYVDDLLKAEIPETSPAPSPDL